MLLQRKYRLPSLTVATFSFVIFTALAGLAFMTVAADRRLDSVESAVQARSVYLRGEALRMNLSKALDREWNSINAVAGTLRMEQIDAARPRLTAISRISSSIAWTGIADASGRLVASSRPEVEGQDVSASMWFRRGLGGSYAGAAERANRLARLVPGDTEGRVQFVDLSAAIRDSDGRVEGVLIYRLNMGWIHSYLVESGKVLDLDLFLVDGRGRVLFDHAEAMPEGLSDRAQQVVSSGQQGTFRVPHDAQNDAFLALLPKIVTGDMASLDWRLVARVPTQISALNIGSFVFSRDILFVILGLSGALMLGTALFCRYFLSPLRILSREAQAIAEGHDIYPNEQHSSREAARLSEAIVRLQRT
ncbi:cache domain-containing protein [Limimaricola litoreus]|uniref:Cache domain-containing protein n=1 Tax=Limimaricola litoreus TaxID=2955316 RepID=A0A9X2JQJ2_9RHOB|nr:cache domain-containing protein [Limimaricola litoreus]MCP1170009.1 cache domain-containing protein [Limimaricola litoreus]